MRTRQFAQATLGAALAAAVILFVAAAPASAATRVTFGALVPASPVYAIDTIEVTGKCPLPDSDARMTDAYNVQWPEVAMAEGVDPANVRVLIDLDSQGKLYGARIADSSGNQLLDNEALVAARLSRYAPEVRHCTSFAQSYFLDVAFE